MAKASFILLTLVAAMLMVTTMAQYDRICFDRFASLWPDECVKQCQKYYKEKLIAVIPPDESTHNTKCLCKYHCFPDGDECNCVPQ